MAHTVITDADPGQSATLAGVIEFAFKKLLQGIDGQLPAEVIRYDRRTNRAMVRPLISRITTQGQRVERATIASIPVLALGGGEFGITFPLKAGDRGWIEASDRDISLFMQTQAQAQPNTLRLHDFADGRFIPDLFADFTLPTKHEQTLLIQHKTGKTYIGVQANELTLSVSDTAITLTPSGITFTAGGNTFTLGSAGMTHNGTNIGSNHTHGGVKNGEGTTSAPQ